MEQNYETIDKCLEEYYHTKNDKLFQDDIYPTLNKISGSIMNDYPLPPYTTRNELSHDMISYAIERLNNIEYDYNKCPSIGAFVNTNMRLYIQGKLSTLRTNKRHADMVYIAEEVDKNEKWDLVALNYDPYMTTEEIEHYCNYLQTISINWYKQERKLVMAIIDILQHPYDHYIYNKNGFIKYISDHYDIPVMTATSAFKKIQLYSTFYSLRYK